MKIVVLDGFTLNPGDLSWEPLSRLGEFICYDRTPDSEIIERIADAQAVITNKTPISRETIESCPDIQYIGVLATGYNVVDLSAASANGIPVTNIPTYGTSSVAQYAMALLLEICHRVQKHSDLVKKGEWSRCSDFSFWRYPLIELAGKTIGIIGFGRIGRKTAELAQAFGMNVLASDPSVKKGRGHGGVSVVDLERLYAESDVISLHCPLLDTNRHMINSNSIAMMKDGVIIINTSRGPLVKEDDLAAALKSGKVYAAGLDVAETEPIPKNSPLLKLENCIITPHIAWAPRESRARLLATAATNLESFMKGKTVNRVF